MCCITQESKTRTNMWLLTNDRAVVFVIAKTAQLNVDKITALIKSRVVKTNFFTKRLKMWLYTKIKSYFLDKLINNGKNCNCKNSSNSSHSRTCLVSLCTTKINSFVHIWCCITQESKTRTNMWPLTNNRAVIFGIVKTA